MINRLNLNEFRGEVQSTLSTIYGNLNKRRVITGIALIGTVFLVAKMVSNDNLFSPEPLIDSLYGIKYNVSNITSSKNNVSNFTSSKNNHCGGAYLFKISVDVSKGNYDFNETTAQLKEGMHNIATRGNYEGPCVTPVKLFTQVKHLYDFPGNDKPYSHDSEDILNNIRRIFNHKAKEYGDSIYLDKFFVTNVNEYPSYKSQFSSYPSSYPLIIVDMINVGRNYISRLRNREDLNRFFNRHRLNFSERIHVLLLLGSFNIFVD